MKPRVFSSTFVAPLSRRQWLARAGVAVASVPSLASLVACGGGSSSAADASSSSGSGSGSTSTPVTSSASYASGAISGFGSIIVNGVRYDETTAVVVDDNGKRLAASALQLGVVVEVAGGTVDASSRAKATQIHCGGGLLGPLEAVDATAGLITVLGQSVSVTADTVLDSTLSTDLSTWTLGQALHVHGLLDSTTATITATRIDVEASPSVYRLRGTVASLDTTAKTFQIGLAVIHYASATSVTSTLADGAVVRVELQTTAVSNQWVANLVAPGQRSAPDTTDAHVHGYVTAWTSATAFSVNGLVVDASAATFPDGTDGVVLGARVEVNGAITSGVLVATRVSLDDTGGSTDDGGSGGSGGGKGHHGRRLFTLHGTLSGLDTTAQTFVLRGLTVSYADSTLVWLDSLASTSLTDGLAVEVRGVLSADRTTLTAVSIGLDS